MIIQACIHDNRNLAQIATRLIASKSTVSREISKFSYIKKGYKFPCLRRSRLNLCNGCAHSGSCLKEKRFYNFKTTEEMSSNLRSSTRSKRKLSTKEIKTIDTIVTDGVRLGQGLHRIYVSNPSLSTICIKKQSGD